MFDYSQISSTVLIFLGTLIRFNEFGVDGGPAAKELAPKIDLAKAHLSSRLGVALPSVEVNECSSLLCSLSVSIYLRRHWRMI